MAFTHRPQIFGRVTLRKVPNSGALNALSTCPSCRRLVQQTCGHCLHCNAILETASGPHTAPRGIKVRRSETTATTALVVALASLLLFPLAPFGIALAMMALHLDHSSGAPDPDNQRYAQRAFVISAGVLAVWTGVIGFFLSA